MTKTSNNTFPALSRTGLRGNAVLIAALAVAALLIAGGLVVGSNARDELRRVDDVSEQINGLIVDADRLGQIHDITRKGWMSYDSNIEHMQLIMQTLTETKQPPDAEFAVGSLDWLGDSAKSISADKVSIAGIELIDEAYQVLHADVLKAFDSYERTVTQLAEVIADWNSHAGDWHAQSLESVDEAVKASLKTHQELDARLSQSISQNRQQQEELGARKQGMLAGTQSSQLVAELSWGSVILGVLLFVGAGAIIYLTRARTPTTATTPQHRPKTLAETPQRRRKAK
ncbi:MAG: hypothetical protein M1546_16180 [Chloroflexi bacterium]|nr:hypothetical protein [Chloroflexota bacterium]